jgi:hypothetical protein
MHLRTGEIETKLKFSFADVLSVIKKLANRAFCSDPTQMDKFYESTYKCIQLWKHLLGF